MKRFYSFKCISYLSEEEIKEKLSGQNISHYAYILHDKDIKEDGTPKENHYHILVTFKGNKSIEGARSYFEDGTNQNTLVKVMEDLNHDFRYLTHKDDEEKYQYNDNDIKIDDTKYWYKVSKDEQLQRADTEEFIDDLMSDNISFKGMAMKYGKDFIRNRRSYIEYRVILRAEERRELKEIQSEEDLKIFADEEQKTIVQRNQFKQYYGEQQSIYKS